MIVFRLAKKQYARKLSGEGAELYGGRWNSVGTPMLYTSESRSLALLELAVHLPLIIKPTQYCLVTIQIPDAIRFQTIAVDSLKNDWMSPSSQKHTQRIGDLFIEKNDYLVLKVPSVIVPGDSNYLINPLHPNFEKVKILKTELFSLDSRLFN
ncbi:MAG: RES domain-containing protein [Chitinophagaceae bacterium]|jgi:RES domain-containing protein|nr:RES domain-containing protein [Chitinophagaceae bacterium]